MFFNLQVEDYRKQKKAFQKSFSYFYKKTNSSARTLFKPGQDDYYLCCKGLIKQLRDDLQLGMKDKSVIKSQFQALIKQIKKCTGKMKQLLCLDAINLFFGTQSANEKHYIPVFEDGFMLLDKIKTKSTEIEDMLLYERIDKSLLYLFHKYPKQIRSWYQRFKKMVPNLINIYKQITNKLTTSEADQIEKNLIKLSISFSDAQIQQPINLPSNKTTVISIIDNDSLQIPLKQWDKLMNISINCQRYKQRLSAKNSISLSTDKKKSRQSLLSLHIEKRNFSMLKINPARNSSFSSKISTRWRYPKKIDPNFMQHNNENQSQKSIRSSRHMNNKNNQIELITQSLSKQHLTSKILHTVMHNQIRVSKNKKNSPGVQNHYRNFYLFCQLNNCFRILQIEKVSVKKILGSYRIKCNVIGFFEDSLQIKVRNDIGKSIKKSNSQQLLTEDECRIILANNIRLEKRFLTFSALTNALIDPYIKFNENKSVIIENTSSQGKEHYGYIRRQNSYFFVKYEIRPYMDIFTTYFCYQVLNISKRSSIHQKNNLKTCTEKDKSKDIFLIGNKKIFNQTANDLYETIEIPSFRFQMLKNVIQQDNSSNSQFLTNQNYFLQIQQQNLKPNTANIFEQTFRRSKMLGRICKKKKREKFMCAVKTNNGYKIIEIDDKNDQYLSGRFYKGSLSCDIVKASNYQLHQVQQNFYDCIDSNSCYKSKIQKLAGKYGLKRSTKYGYLLSWVSYYDGQFHVSTYIKSLQKTFIFDFQYKFLFSKQKSNLVDSVMGQIKFIDDQQSVILLVLKENGQQKRIYPKEVFYMNYKMKKSDENSGFIELLYLKQYKQNEENVSRKVMRKYYRLSTYLWNMLIFQVQWQKIFSTYQPKSYAQLRSIIKKYAIKKPINFTKQKNAKTKNQIYFYPLIDFPEILKLDVSDVKNIRLSKFNETIKFQEIHKKLDENSYGCFNMLAKSRKAEIKVVKRILKEYYRNIY